MRGEIVPGLDRWRIFEDEVSNGVYEVRVVRATGESLGLIGSDPDELRKLLIDQAKDLEQKRTAP